MNIRPIHTDDDYRAALREASAMFDDQPEPGTERGDYFEILTTLIEAYEAKTFPIDLPDPIEAIKFRMEQLGLSPKDLAPAIGKPNRVYEVLSGKRRLTLKMVWRLHSDFGIPAASLIAPSKRTRVV
jgi:HTH-type transcriptional regulator/antitoxin HigA